MAKAKPLPPIEQLRELLDYDPESGVLRWRVSKSNVCAGHEVRTQTKGYIVVRVCGCAYRAHRICYYMGTGIDPGEYEIDHIDRNPSNNRLANLRLADRALNSCNQRINGRNMRRPITITHPDGSTITAKHQRAAAWLLQCHSRTVTRWAEIATPHPSTGITIAYAE